VKLKLVILCTKTDLLELFEAVTRSGFLRHSVV